MNRVMNVVMMLGVLGVAAASPASAQDAQKPKMAMPAGVDIMLMKPATAKMGENALEVMVKGKDGKPMNGADVSVLFVMPAMPAMKMAEMRNDVKLKASDGGMYMGMANVMMAGTWNVTISVKEKGKEIGQKKLTLTAK
jgi:hypothetical protein